MVIRALIDQSDGNRIRYCVIFRAFQDYAQEILSP